MTTAFQILPPARSWPAPAEELAQALVAGARRPTVEAGLALLLRLGVDFWAREDLQPFYRRDDDGAAYVMWRDLELELSDLRVPASQGERSVVQLAGSIAYGVECDLEWALGHLTAELLEVYISAVRHAASAEDGEG